MSIQTELTRITNAKAAIKAAIEGKGVTVPDATLLDGIAALIDSIEAGGGGNIETITFTPANTGTLNIDFETNGIPIAVICVRNSFANGESDAYYTDKNEVPMACTLIESYNPNSSGSDIGYQYPFHVYNNSTIEFTPNVYNNGRTRISSFQSATSSKIAIIKNKNLLPKFPTFSVYVNSSGSKGLRVGETYTAMCLFRS